MIQVCVRIHRRWLQNQGGGMRTIAVLVMGLCVVLPLHESYAVTNYMYGGTYSSWPTAWKPILSLNDPDDGLTERYDFVGDAADPCAYWDANSEYFYFRMRVDDGAPGSNLWGGTAWLFIDQMDNGTGTMDYAIAWDYKSNVQEWHGLELQVPDTVGEWWGETRPQDADGESNWKGAPPDSSLTGTAFLVTIENQSTVNFGTTTLIEMALPWSTLTNSTTLRPGQSWALQVGSTANANDHNWIDTDIGCNHNPTDAGLSWSDAIIVEIPEPGTIGLALIGLAGLVCRRVARRL
jgi:hypothetical protein